MLGVDISKIPFSWSDYLMSINLILPYFAYILICFTSGAYANRLKRPGVDSNTKQSIKENIYIKSTIRLSTAIAILIISSKCIYEFGLYAIPVAKIGIIFFFAITLTYSIEHLSKYIVEILIIFTAILSISKAQSDSIKDYCRTQSILKIESRDDYKIIRSTDKGYIAKGEDDSLLFITEDGKIITNINYNAERNLCNLRLISEIPF